MINNKQKKISLEDILMSMLSIYKFKKKTMIIPFTI